MPPKKGKRTSTRQSTSTQSVEAGDNASNSQSHGRATRTRSASAAKRSTTPAQTQARVKRRRSQSAQASSSEEEGEISTQIIEQTGRQGAITTDVRAGQQGSGVDSTDDELDYEDNLSNTNDNASYHSTSEEDSAPELSQRAATSESDDEQVAGPSNDLDSVRRHSKGGNSRSGKPPTAAETLARMQKIVDKRGYVGPRDLQRISLGLDLKTGRDRVLREDRRAKVAAGGGDREHTPPSGHNKGRTRVSFSSPLCDKMDREVIRADSEVTLYKPAVKNKINPVRASSSSEEFNMSDESADYMAPVSCGRNLIHNDPEYDNANEHDEGVPTNEFIAEIRRHYEDRRWRSVEPVRGREAYDRDQGARGYDRDLDRRSPARSYGNTLPEDKADELIREAEQNKARIYGTPGTVNQHVPIDLEKNYVHSLMVDETYMLVAAHLDETMIMRIEEGKFVDFSKLLSKDKLKEQLGTEYRMVIKDGRSHYVPVAEAEVINCYARWEQAFRVYSDIYTRVNPSRAAELIQYNHIIHSISTSYMWENVYQYDQDFRLHMSKNPRRSWAIILQMSWSIRLQDKLRHGHGDGGPSRGGTPGRPRAGGNQRGHNANEPCRIFNRGKCTYGSTCKFEHRCSYCFRFGHPAVRCRKAEQDRGTGEAREQPRPAAPKPERTPELAKRDK